jgi:IS30 family transposase
MAKIYRQLSAKERGMVMGMGMKAQHCSVRAIAKVTGRSPITISRELRRNGWQSETEQCVMGRTRIAGGYDAHRAGKRARRVRRAAWPVRKLHRDGPLWAVVGRGWGMLALKLSPEQIAAKLKLRHPGQIQLQASHETIYTAEGQAIHTRTQLRQGFHGQAHIHGVAPQPVKLKTTLIGALPVWL